MNDHQLLQKKAPAFLNVILIVFLSVLTSSFALPFMRLLINDGVSSVWIAGLRMVALLILIWPAQIFNKNLRFNVWHVSRKEMKWMGLAGILLACHFITLALAIGYTTIFGSASIFSTQYLFTVVIAAVFLHERPGKGSIASIIMSLLGIIVISWSDFNFQGDMTGSILSLISAFFFAAYYVAGRYIRKTMDTGTYTIWVNTISAILLMAAACIINHPYKPLTIQNIAAFFGLAVFGSLGGHFATNWALKYVRSDVTSIIYLSQPVFAAYIGYVFFQEQVRLEVALGALLILFGIAFYILIQMKRKAKNKTENI